MRHEWHVRPWTTNAVHIVLDGILDPELGADATPFDIARDVFRQRKRFARNVGQAWSRVEMRPIYRDMANVWRAFHTGKDWMR